MVRRVGLLLFALLALCGFDPSRCAEPSETSAASEKPAAAEEPAAAEKSEKPAAAAADSSTSSSSSSNGTESVLASLADARAQLEGTQETHQYQTEVNRLLDIIINSLYTQREVFLRELISNGVDALEKARFLSISDSSRSAAAEGLELAIHIETDEQQKLLSICDSGVGMSKQELITNLGTVAKSGTSNFLEALAQNNNDVNLIGQFGVGFYSAFLVSDRVTVVSRQLDGEQHIWESSADAKYYISKDPRGNTMKRGTCVLLHLKSDATEFLDPNKLKYLIKRYSQFMVYPIYLKMKKIVTEEVPEETKETEEKKEEKDDVEVKDEAEEEKPKTKTVEKEVFTYERINEQKALWLRPKEEITETEYKEFYKSISNDWSEPLLHIHFSAEGEVDFKALLYIPTRPPADVFSQYFGKQTSIKLYVRRVLVADVFDDLLPKYLHFIRGVVDSDDLPLNVSREQLQQHKLLEIISKKLVRKTIDTIRKLYTDGQKEKEELRKKLEELDDEETKKETEKKLKEPTLFSNFYKEFSRNLLLGCYEDETNRNKIAKILLFKTSKNAEEPITLEQYIERMKEGQSAIYYAAGETKEQLLAQPQMQIFKKKDIEVLLLLEAMDEPCIQRLDAFDGKRFESIQKGNLSLDETAAEKKRFKRVVQHYDPLVKYLKNLLGPKVTKVEVSRRLVDAPCAVVGSSWGYSAQMEKIMKSQTFADPLHMQMMRGQKVLEINPNHKLIQHLLKKVKEGTGKVDGETKDVGKEERELVEQLFGAAMLASGYEVEKPQELAAVLYKGLGAQAGIEGDDLINEDLDLPPEEEDEEEETGKETGKETEEETEPSADDIFSSIKLDAEEKLKEEETKEDKSKDTVKDEL